MSLDSPALTPPLAPFATLRVRRVRRLAPTEDAEDPDDEAALPRVKLDSDTLSEEALEAPALSSALPESLSGSLSSAGDGPSGVPRPGSCGACTLWAGVGSAVRSLRSKHGGGT